MKMKLFASGLLWICTNFTTNWNTLWGQNHSAGNYIQILTL